MAVSVKRLLVAAAFVVANFGAAHAQESGDSDFVAVAAESLCLAALEHRTRPDVWIAQRASEYRLSAVDRMQAPAFAVNAAWRDPSNVYVIDHGFGSCAINVDAQRAGAHEAMVAALTAHVPVLEDLTPRRITPEDVSNLFCGDRPFGSVAAFITTSNSVAGPRLVLMMVADHHKSCGEIVQFFLGTAPEQR